MHRCLSIPEILRMIFEELLRCNAPDLKALARLAQTCRGFSDLALDILWKDLNSAIPLLKSFPPHIWEISGTTHQKTFRFRLPIKAADWDRVLGYAARIRKISLGYGIPQLEVLELLSLSLPAEHFLPNLQGLRWLPNDPRVFPYIRLFTSPNLTVIELSIDSSLASSSLLSLLASRFSYITDLTLRWSGGDGPTLDTLGSLVSALTHLERLCVPHLDPSAYQHLPSVATLRHLSLNNFSSFPDDSGSWSHTDPTFSGLSHLRLRSDTITPTATALLSTFSNTPLQSFRCESGCIPSVVTVRELCLALAGGCSRSHLRQVYLELGSEELDNPTLATITPDVISPLLIFSNLRKVRVEAGTSFALDDAFCTALATAWPRLEALTLNTNSAHGALWPSTVGLLTLTAFARHCPLLAELSITLNAQGFPDALPHPQAQRVSQRALKYLDVARSSIDSPFDVARFLSRTFPALTAINSWYLLRNEINPTKWTEVQKLLPMLVAIRKEEEIYWRAQAL
ncbi:hypothetical protein B0H16DRAFT_1469234 [Mycena metata]|uniref:F-box domain-containing protein n=1 Tax=Mycena metata TaxID=1033252 RepID=A0AAD7MTC5_9AGAR|nr:hypothetical protein B0H16DRAFT_1469234 [Mycena metata]